MQFPDYIQVLWARKWLIILTMIVAVTVTGLGSYLISPVYSATAVVRILTPNNGNSDWLQPNIEYADRLMNTLSEVAVTDPVLETLMRELNLQSIPDFEVAIVPNSELMRITAEHNDPTVARDIANRLAALVILHSQQADATDEGTATDTLIAELRNAEAELTKAAEAYERVLNTSPQDAARVEAARQTYSLRDNIYQTTLRLFERTSFRDTIRASTLRIIDPADVPALPSKPQRILMIAIGLVMGAIAGVGLASLFEKLETKLYTTEQIEAVTELDVLAKIPNAKRNRAGLFASHLPQAEAFRRLTIHLLSMDRPNRLQTLLVTSAEPEEGKSTVTANLALAIAQTGKEVVVIDTDTRCPSLHKIFGLDNEAGLSDFLRKKVTLDACLQQTRFPRVQVLTSGKLYGNANPTLLLTSPQMNSLLRHLAQQFDVILLDTPAYLAVTDAAVLAPVADGVLLVVRHGRIRKRTVLSVCQQLRSVNANLIGVVINRAERKDMYGRRYYQALPEEQDNDVSEPQ
jgi:capsular exopolysaccharide synthesis family protein